MQDHSPLPEKQPSTPKSSSRVPAGIVAGLSAVVLATGGVTAWLTMRPSSTDVPPPTATSISPTQPDTAQPQTTLQVPVEQAVQVYWLKDTGTSLELVPAPVTVNASNEPETLLKGAFDQLLKGPADPAAASTIPVDTQLRNLEIRADGIHVDLSQAFTSGGGSTSMTGRLGQIIYTATTLDPAAKVWISVEGKPLELLGGEGLIIDQPMTRTDFEQNFQL